MNNDPRSMAHLFLTIPSNKPNVHTSSIHLGERQPFERLRIATVLHALTCPMNVPTMVQLELATTDAVIFATAGRTLRRS